MDMILQGRRFGSNSFLYCGACRPADTRRVSDEVFEERFLGICHNTEDFVTAAKSTGLGNTRKLSKWKVFEVLNERDFVFSIQHVKLEMTRR